MRIVNDDDIYFIDKDSNMVDTLQLILEDAKNNGFVSIHVKADIDYSSDTWVKMANMMNDYRWINILFV